MRTARLISVTTVAAIAALALTACGDDGEGSGGNAVPSSWIRSEYRSAAPGAGWTDTTDGLSVVAKEIHGHTSARDRISTPDVELLRYRDDIVAVTPLAAGGSRIEIDDYRTGHQRWRSRIGSLWPNPDSAFRGGGPGSGK